MFSKLKDLFSSLTPDQSSGQRRKIPTDRILGKCKVQIMELEKRGRGARVTRSGEGGERWTEKMDTLAPCPPTENGDDVAIGPAARSISITTIR